MADNHYDVIIIGSGAGGGTLAHRLAPSGKRILVLERGGYVPREKENWDSHAVVAESRYHIRPPPGAPRVKRFGSSKQQRPGGISRQAATMSRF